MKNSFYIIFSILIITACNNQDQNTSIVTEKVDWSNDRVCSISVDEAFINNIIKNMTLEQKVGQIIMPDIDEVTPQDAKQYQFCLLYTSPSPRDKRQSRMPSSA